MAPEKHYYLNLENGKLGGSGAARTTTADLDELFSNLAGDPLRDTITIHFHGGLVGESAGLKIAESLVPEYRQAGSYPIFFVWESGWSEVLLRNLGDIFQERIFKRLASLLTRFALGKLDQTDGQRAAGIRLELPSESEVLQELENPAVAGEPYHDVDPSRLPTDGELGGGEEEQLAEILRLDNVVATEAAAIANSLLTDDEVEAERDRTRGARVMASSQTLMSPEILQQMRDEAAAPGERSLWLSTLLVKKGIAVLQNVISRFSQRRDHGLYPTVAEEILRELYLANAGGALWAEMKKDTNDAFGADSGVFGGTAFLERLAAFSAQSPPRIILVGHSTGAVYICNFIKHADEVLPPGIKFDIVFLAAACNFKLFADMIREHGHRIAGIRAFGMQDALEKQDHLVPVAYPRSLLYFVSGLLEDEADSPLVGMERYFQGDVYDGADPDLLAGRAHLEAAQAGLIWSVSSEGPGRNSAAKAHTAFDDEAATISSVAQIIANGLP